ncbi:DeoR/GlpR family DNA-binding transcription regulator [Actinotalea sp. K2]|uniref:DeoR/GlpR family DNA-binding transcription regulator n=1 Tax=Actinotalea sp. K2 TaxID=2939438 RepID=UPI002017ED66|nr:DeoR/GlpR family DNA-binding transcription regulator [Actinotalea sp. K2]MCL3861175.1 DeoR/GlpR family DNA-binding transcription regulator [Actinotalea sp. K2]
MSTTTDGSSRRLPAGRKAELAAYIAETGQVTVANLAERFDVSADTIRRDLDQLDAEGVLIRTHGGAISSQAVPRPDTGMDVRLRLQTSAKDQIGALAAGLVRDGATLMINAGTTTLAAARHLSEHRDLTIATNSLRLPTELHPLAFRDLYVFGGLVRVSAQGTVGAVAFPSQSGADREIRCDLALIGVGAVNTDAGYSTSNLGEATMIREMMDRSSRVAVLADSTKFGRRLFAQIAELGHADYLVTDSPPPDELAEALRAADVEIIRPEA